jgi:CIC family chloride channel protein
MTPLLRSAILGILSALPVACVLWIWQRGAPNPWIWTWGIALGSIFIALPLRKGPELSGLAGVLRSVYSPVGFGFRRRNIFYSLGELFLGAMGGRSGPEGLSLVTSEQTATLLRPRAEHWSEQHRRTEVASVLAATLSAALGSPLAALVFVAELQIGGQALRVAVSAICAHFSIFFLREQGVLRDLGLRWNFEGSLGLFGVNTSLQALAYGSIVIAGGLLAAALIHAHRVGRFGLQSFWSPIGGGALLIAAGLLFPQMRLPIPEWVQMSIGEARWAFAIAALLCWLVLTSLFRARGVFWWVLILGGCLGALSELLAPGWGRAGGFLGMAALWGALFGAPISGALLIYELSRESSLLIPAFAGAWVAWRLRRSIVDATWIDEELKGLGIELKRGRLAGILDELLVKDAMVHNFTSVYERDPIRVLYDKLLESTYPFLVVTDSRGSYLGVITADQIEKFWNRQEQSAGAERVQQIVEARDLLYRPGTEVPTVFADDRLSVAADLVARNAVVPVIGNDSQVLGLLFSHNVRILYDRKAAHRVIQEMLRWRAP